MANGNPPIDRVCDCLDCTGCAACTLACKFGALMMVEDNEGFMRPSIETGLCVGCEACRRVCPGLNDLPVGTSEFYMAWNVDPAVLGRCSSGGVFDALAAFVLKRDGVVFGAAMDSATRELRHVWVESANQLDALRRSKYYQSDTRRAFSEVVKFLKAGRWVLFTGTACQIAGLLAIAGKTKGCDLSRLVTMDVLCHGVTSKKVVDAYVASKEGAVGAPVVDLAFRRKHGELGWARGNSTITVTTHLLPDGTTSERMDEIDMRGTFFAGFNRNVFLRESCYRCRYCGTERISDFTAADFWGVPSERVSEWQYWHGVSLLLVNSEKARLMMSELGLWLHFESIDKGDALPYNRSLNLPNERPDFRDSFFDDLQNSSYDGLIRRYYGREIIVGDLKRKARNVLGNGVYDGLKKLAGRGD